MENIFKYTTEGFIVMYLSKYQILQQQELEYFAENQDIFNDQSKCHIYFILKRPRTTINGSYFKFNDDYFELEVEIQIKNRFINRLLKIDNPYKSKNAKLITDYPYNYFEIQTEEHNFAFKTGALLDYIQQINPIKDDLLDYEILYIGQSYGEAGNRTAIDRLISHSTLQKIYNEAIIKHPDSEIWLMLSSFAQTNISSTNGQITARTENESLDRERFINFMDTKFSEQQKINFTEAALIRAFQPKFNIEYKNTFPNPAHSSYNECYKLDLNGIAIEIDLSSMNRWLYSDHKPRGLNDDLVRYWQHDVFYFVTDDDRYKIFNNDYIG
ncbi:hypothetical protein [Spirosoma foliorum]|uniref:Uncharacterized protein n=1 Tax=Spirosoma foliorum TaxID=2710596 RepID=A0A7G5H079_9BACT|nr:hypothetical protein [Spirosoma foliorum]QMW04521.1 hypothetical protein H3H32_06155 [Spirosoma foliorum]